MEQKTSKHTVIILITVLILLLSNAFLVWKVFKQSDKMASYESSISAINDSVRVSVKNGISTYSKKAPEIDLEQLTNSEFFRTLSSDQQKFFTELKNVRGLISATQAQLEKQGIAIDQLKLTGIGTLVDNGDSVEFKTGQVLNFIERDTTKNLQWKSSVALKSPIDFKLTYDYKFDIKSTFQRQKDKSVVVSYVMNDPELKVNKMQNFIIPKEEKLTWLGRFIDKNKKPLMIIGGAVIFSAGTYAGFTLHP